MFLSSIAHGLVATLVLLQQVQQASAVQGFFRVATGVLVQEAADPIKSSGKRSGHAHTIAGGSNFGLTLDFDTMRSSNCTSSPVMEDTSAYWTPLVYFAHRNGTYIPLDFTNQGQQIYYVYAETDVPFPNGLRMIAGQTTARTYKQPLNARPNYIEHDCIGGKQGKYPGIPTELCPDKVRGNVYFPSCGWANQTLDSWDHQSHMAYRGPNGCPDTHPIGYPELHYELYWSNDVEGYPWSDAMNQTQPFVYSNGDPTGLGFHGDFFNAWKPEALAGAMKDCAGGGSSGEPSLCPQHFTMKAPGTPACVKKGLSPDLGNNEDIHAPLAKLPGCNKITWTEEEAAAQAAAPCDAESAPPAVGGASSSSSTSLSSSTSSTAKGTTSTSSVSKSSTTSKAATTSKPAVTSTSKSSSKAPLPTPTRRRHRLNPYKHS